MNAASMMEIDNIIAAGCGGGFDKKAAASASDLKKDSSSWYQTPPSCSPYSKSIMQIIVSYTYNIKY